MSKPIRENSRFKFSLSIVPILSLLLIASLSLFAQAGKSAVMQVDQVSLQLNNSGMLVELNSQAQWPQPVGNSYLVHVGLFIGAEVVDANGIVQTIFSDGFSPDNGGDYDTGSGDPWKFSPLPEYDNPAQSSIARSDDPTTWPSNWTAWPGLLGDNVFSANLETFWGMHDRNNKEFNYFPYTNQPDWQGLGLEVEGRAYQWVNAAFEDITIFVFDITNASDKSLNKLVTGIFADAQIGGPNSFSDDSLTADLANELAIYSTPSTYVPDPNLPVPGIVAFHPVETPNNLGLTSLTDPLWGSQNRPRNDDWLWQQTTPSTYSFGNFSADRSLTMGSGYFSLAPGQSTRYAVAILFAEDRSEMLTTFDNAKWIYNQVLTGIEDEQPLHTSTFRLEQNYPNPFNPQTTIRYFLPRAAEVTLTVVNSLGQTVRSLFSGKQSAGEQSTVWNGQTDGGQSATSGIYFYRLESPEGMQYRKMILMK